MNRFFKPYIYSIITLNIVVFVNSIITDDFIQSIDLLAMIILIVSIFSEVRSLAYRQSVNMSLSGPITIFAVFYKPLIFVYLMIICYLTIAKLYMKYRLKECNCVFDIKWIYNISQYIILAKIISLFSKLIMSNINTPFLFILYLILGIFIDNVVNLAFTAIVIILYSNKNVFKEYKLKNIMYSVYYYTIILILLIYSYEAYNILGPIMISLLILPIQGTILQSASLYELNRKLITDKMTGAFNRYFLEETLMENIEQSREFTLLFLDLDKFKKINDDYGHVAGDAVLIDFVTQLKKHLRREDRIFRYGGDEFCVLLSEKEKAKGLMERLRNNDLFNKCIFADKQIEYTFSIGCLDYNGDPDITFDDLIDKVDKNMYVEKKIKCRN